VNAGSAVVYENDFLRLIQAKYEKRILKNKKDVDG
jgi:hypothetical protein